VVGALFGAVGGWLLQKSRAGGGETSEGKRRGDLDGRRIMNLVLSALGVIRQVAELE
jgi:hypothetical protein